jgi:hypothetical protein
MLGRISDFLGNKSQSQIPKTQQSQPQTLETQQSQTGTVNTGIEKEPYYNYNLKQKLKKIKSDNIETQTSVKDLNDVTQNDVIAYTYSMYNGQYTQIDFGVVSTIEEDEESNIIFLDSIAYINDENSHLSKKSNEKAIKFDYNKTTKVVSNIEVFNNTKFIPVLVCKVIGTWENTPPNSGGKRRSNKRRSNKLRVVSKRRHRKSSLAKRRSIKRRTRR